MIDNFLTINKILKFDNDDDFYMLQVIKRRKENPEMETNSLVLKTTYLQSEGQLLRLKDDLVDLADRHNARVYVNPCRKSFRKCTIACLKEFADRIACENYAKPYKIFDSVAGACGSNRAIWVVDVDWNELDDVVFAGEFSLEMEQRIYINKMCEFINTLKPDVDDKIVAVNRTVNGAHVLTTPFNAADFRQKYPNVTVHKNNPTLVYCK